MDPLRAIELARAAADTERSVPAFLRHLRQSDATLQRAGFPPISEWWWAEIRRFFGALTGTADGPRQWVLRVGRRGGKSSTLCRVAVSWALAGPWDVPPGDTGYVMLCSTKRGEAAGRIATIGTILRELGVKHTRAGETIDLAGRNAAFRVFTASVSGVAGPTAIMAIGDEVALWRDSETGANPAAEVFAQLRPTVATQPWAPIILSSSAYSKTDYHAVQFSLGNTPAQRVSVASTWQANPSVTEGDTRALEPDDRAWARQYASIPQDTVTESWFGHDVIDACVDRGRLETPDAPPGAHVIVAADAAFSRDRFAVAAVVSQRGDRSAARITSVLGTWALTPDDSGPLLPSACVAYAAAICRRFGTSQVLLDQFAAEPLREMFLAHDVYAKVSPWTATNKAARFRAVREAMLERLLRLPDEPELLRELHGVAGRLMAAGHERIEAAEGYDDRVHALVMAAHAALEHGAHVAPDIAPVETAADRWEAAIQREIEADDAPNDWYS